MPASWYIADLENRVVLRVRGEIEVGIGEKDDEGDRAGVSSAHEWGRARRTRESGRTRYSSRTHGLQLLPQHSHGSGSLGGRAEPAAFTRSRQREGARRLRRRRARAGERSRRSSSSKLGCVELAMEHVRRERARSSRAAARSEEDRRRTSSATHCAACQSRLSYSRCS